MQAAATKPAIDAPVKHALLVLHCISSGADGSEIHTCLQPWAALVIGFLSGALYVGASRLVAHTLKVDDPLDAIAVHCCCGAWGLIAAALFASHEPTLAAYPDMGDNYGTYCSFRVHFCINPKASNGDTSVNEMVHRGKRSHAHRTHVACSKGLCLT